jgi:class 3 adenylate cyclase
VFGFCDIRRFTDTTEVLQEGVMEFVNTIAHLVHGAVAARGGAANKNIGDAFLLVGGIMLCLWLFLTRGGLLTTAGGLTSAVKDWLSTCLQTAAREQTVNITAAACPSSRCGSCPRALTSVTSAASAHQGSARSSSSAAATAIQEEHPAGW